MPKVFGHCAAGCDYEVPTKKEFDAYATTTSRFPAPTLNTEKKLTDHGYYFIGYGFDHYQYHFGLVYWAGVEIEIPATISCSSTSVGNDLQIICGKVASDGSITIKSRYTTISGEIRIEEVTDGNIYTAKIVDTALPDLADGESY